jgi:ActR/RegA family two-component response regulator
MPLDCLLVSRDRQVVDILRPAMEKLGINLEVCAGAHSGHEILLSEKFDGVVVDCDDLDGGLNVLQNLRRGTSNKNSVAFAILNGTTAASKAFELGANFVLQKPVLPLSALRCFSAAVGQMTRERRRYFRVPVDMPTIVTLSGGQEIRGTASNLSEGGLAIKFNGPAPNVPIMKVQFKLPATNNSIETKAQLAWADGSGRAGIRFLEVPQNSREHLDRWLARNIDALQTQHTF